MIQEVEYREIPGFPGYRVGSDGSVWSWRCKAGTRSWRWKELKPWKMKGDYRVVGLNRDDKRHYKLVHHLVLESFVGPRPEGMEACHNNNIPYDNTVGNLRWDTPKNNCKDRADNGFIHKTSRGEKHGCSKLTWEQVRDIRSKFAGKEFKRKQLAEMYRVTLTTICDIINNKIWKEI